MGELAESYVRWADVETRGSSPSYEGWARAIAADDQVLALIGALPARKRQPNLVFAAARTAGAPLDEYHRFRPWLVRHWPEVADIVLARSTQTNEAARCALLVPELARLDGPLALVEVGASAGLCLYPDRYSYRYRTPDGVVALDPVTGPSSVVIGCAIDAGIAAPTRLPDVAWRAGIDLNPLDVGDPDDVAWLRALVWPEHHDRRERLEAACALVATDRPHLVRGDLLDDLDELLGSAPTDAHLVVFHSQVLMYVEPAGRERFVERMRGLDGTWISHEDSRVLGSSAGLAHDGRTVLTVDDVPVARADPHGRSIERL
ncbi:DUF2332 domain-containing protein [Oerskovia sp. Sa1BUA8]|uniref:DUF2332 domain-containing protein n=1 Tax=Oerskovia douganii TaxID=2762210 RepID=A0A9D5YZI6_9CELL|nr:DUF2332 domain-containing protein [Oerskovia douganii]MBE7700074.1 DUF2332 domain-containing protein [Oerskovia douganii]